MLASKEMRRATGIITIIIISAVSLECERYLLKPFVGIVLYVTLSTYVLSLFWGEKKKD